MSTFKYVLKRLAFMVLTFLIIISVCFILIRLLPSEPATMFGKDMALVEQARIRQGLLDANGNPDITTNVTIITDYMVSKGLQLNNTYQEIEGLFTMYPKDFFCPKDFHSQEIRITQNTVCIHHFNMSWHSETVRYEWKIRWFCNKWLPASMASACTRFLIKRLHELRSILHKLRNSN